VHARIRGNGFSSKDPDRLEKNITAIRYDRGHPAIERDPEPILALRLGSTSH